MDVLDGLQLDCDQEKVIKTLIETVQPDEIPVPIDYFHRKPISVDVWKKNEHSKVSIPLRIWVQRQKDVDIKNWTGPLLGDKERRENSMGLVGIWNLGSDEYHAIYVTRCRRLERGIDESMTSSLSLNLPGVGFAFDFLNSWGKEQEEQHEKILLNSELTDLYYISLYSSRKPNENMTPVKSSESARGAVTVAATKGGSVVILSSQGNACEEGGVVTLLGIYEEKGIHCEVIEIVPLFDIFQNQISNKS